MSSTRTSKILLIAATGAQNAANASNGKLRQFKHICQRVSAHIFDKAMLRMLKWHWTGADQ
jgi:hypothetical protein